LVAGFDLARRSWGGIGLFVLAWALVGTVVVLSIALTQPPAGLLEAPAAPAATVAPAEGAVPSEAAETLAATPASETAQEREQREWLGKAWPMLLLCVVILIVAGLLIQGGQIGYIIQRLRTGQVTWANIARHATSAFGALLGAAFLSMALVAGAVVVVVLAVAALSAVAPAAVGVVGVLVAVTLIPVGVWLSIRLALWPLAIVADQQGPVTGLKISWRMARGRWWTLAGIAAAMLAVSIGAALLLALLEGAGNLAGGAVALVIQVLTGLTGFVANVFISFATMGALARFYEDAKTAGT
jgi:hypothetical protein